MTVKLTGLDLRDDHINAFLAKVNELVASGGGSVPGANVIPKSDGSGLVASGITDDGAKVTTSRDLWLSGNGSPQGQHLIVAPNGLWFQNTVTGMLVDLKLIDSVALGSVDTSLGARLATTVAGDNRTSKAGGAGTLTNYGIYGNAINGDVNISGFFDNGDFVVNGAASYATSITCSGVNPSTRRGISAIYVPATTAESPIALQGQVAGVIDTSALARAVQGVVGVVSTTRSGGNPLTNTGVYGSATGGQTNYSGFFDQGTFQVQGTAVFASQVFGVAATSVQWSGNAITQGWERIDKRLQLTSRLAPAQITANTNDYAPSGINDAVVLELTTDAARDLTGIVPDSGTGNGRLLWVINTGAFNLVLKHDTTSSSNNRFLLRGAADVTLTPNTGALLWWNATNAKWRQIGTL